MLYAVIIKDNLRNPKVNKNAQAFKEQMAKVPPKQSKNQARN